MKRVVVIGQAPARPGSRHSVPGTYLRPWLHQIGLGETDIEAYFTFAALMPEFPGSAGGSHLPPTPEQILAHRPFLKRLMAEARPEVVVPVGRPAIASLLPEPQRPLAEVIGRAYELDPYQTLGRAVTVIPLPHPSGRSTWVSSHRALLDQALALLAEALAGPTP